MKRFYTNVVNLLFLICITPLNIYSKFTLFRIVFYSSSSKEKSLQNKKHKKGSAEQRYDALHHQRVAENELGMPSFLTCYFPLRLDSETNILTKAFQHPSPQKWYFSIIVILVPKF